MNRGISSVSMKVSGMFLQQNSCGTVGEEKEKEMDPHRTSSFKDNDVVLFPVL